MITDNGKELIAKFLLNEVPAYATHLAVGCGATPLKNTDITPLGLAEKQTLDFEMFRVPITSKGFVDENGTTKISLTAELPTENRYEITEVGIWSARNNTLASDYDSRQILDFSKSWQVHNTSIYNPPIINNLAASANSFDIYDQGNLVFFANTSDNVFQGTSRKERKEGPRNLSTTILMRGDSSKISGVDGSWYAESIDGETVPTHIHLNNINFDISKNSAADCFKIALSLIDRTAETKNISVLPDKVNILMEFYTNESVTSNGYAKIEIELSGSDLLNNRYKSINLPLSQSSDNNYRFITAPDFSSANIKICRIFVSAIDSLGVPLQDYYVAFDGLRIENITTQNPTYKMSGYTIIKNPKGIPIIKNQNANNYIDFRFNLGIL